MRFSLICNKLSLNWLLAACLPLSVGYSQATSPAPGDGEVILIDAMTIVGSKENLERLPGSGAFVDLGEIRTFSYDDINQVIRRIPGVYIRQEDGYGLFPNVSLRGVSTTRNSKITVMEDGILMAPAPYSDPAAYYTPNAGRMSGLEVLKGSSQIKYGPETTGGVINYLSTPIPATTSGFLEAAYGSNNDVRLHAYYGGRYDAGWATVGVLLENVYRETDGFKTILPALGGGYAGSRQTGFDRNEPLVKLRLDLATSRPQSIELKYGRTDIRADETYLGLTEADFRADPFQRYAASRYDRIDTEQERFSLHYAARPLDDLRLTLTAYRTDFARNWYKLNDAGVGTGGFLNLSEALAGEHGDAILNVLKGSEAGRLRVRANNRVYGSRGAQAGLTWDFDVAGAQHRLEVGLRHHQDFGDRFQWQDIFTQAADGSAVLTTPGLPGTQDNRRGETTATALHILDEITFDRLILMPGFRAEFIDYNDIRRSTAPATLSQELSRASKSFTTFSPGLGLTWRQSDQVTWLAGVHRGISPPGPGSTRNELVEEHSLGLEAGFRYRQGGLALEVVAFHTAFTDLIVEANAGGGGGLGITQNIGEVDSSGLEVLATYDPVATRDLGFLNPWTFSFTYTHARLGNDVNATGNSGGVAESIFSGGRRGNQLPYIPEYQFSLGTALDFDRWSFHLDTYYQPRVYTSANNSSAQLNPDASAAAGLQPRRDSRYGSLGAFFLLDLAAHYRLTDEVRFKLACTNVLGRDYIASRVPIGPRPGAPRTYTAGVEVRF